MLSLSVGSTARPPISYSGIVVVGYYGIVISPAAFVPDSEAGVGSQISGRESTFLRGQESGKM